LIESQKKHRTLRETYLEQLATAIVLEKSPQLDDPHKETQLKRRIKEAINRIWKKERRQAMYSSIGKTLNTREIHTAGISRVDIPAPSDSTSPETIDPKFWKGPWRSITDPEEICFYVCQANIKQYNQAKHTPFRSGDLAKSLQRTIISPLFQEEIKAHVRRTKHHTILNETKVVLDYISCPYVTVIKIQQ
jgi:hypothetical protein